jgi:hypothetical protein
MVKINLVLPGGDARGGYVNIDPYVDPGDKDRVGGSISNLDGVAEDAEVIDLIALDVVDFLPTPDVGGVLSHWVGKIRHGGTITVGGVDIREVAKSLMSQQITAGEADVLLHGAQRAPWEYRKSSSTLQAMISALQGYGFRIERKFVRDYHYYVTARRP